MSASGLSHMIIESGIYVRYVRKCYKLQTSYMYLALISNNLIYINMRISSLKQNACLQNAHNMTVGHFSLFQQYCIICILPQNSKTSPCKYQCQTVWFTIKGLHTNDTLRKLLFSKVHMIYIRYEGSPFFSDFYK